jgi:hypothetical protein
LITADILGEAGPEAGCRFKADMSKSAGSWADSFGVPANIGVLFPDLFIFLVAIGDTGREEVGEEGPALAPASFFNAETGPLGASFSFADY